MSNTTRGKSNVDTRLGEEIEGGRAIAFKDVVKMTSIEGQRYEVNGGYMPYMQISRGRTFEKNTYSSVCFTDDITSQRGNA